MIIILSIVVDSNQFLIIQFHLIIFLILMLIVIIHFLNQVLIINSYSINRKFILANHHFISYKFQSID